MVTAGVPFNVKGTTNILRVAPCDERLISRVDPEVASPSIGTVFGGMHGYGPVLSIGIVLGVLDDSIAAIGLCRKVAPPRVGAVMVLIASDRLVVIAVLNRPGGYTFDEVPRRYGRRVRPFDQLTRLGQFALARLAAPAPIAARFVTRTAGQSGMPSRALNTRPGDGNAQDEDQVGGEEAVSASRPPVG